MDKYLDRIKAEQTGIAADLPTLQMLQRRHLQYVPFENLDIHWRQPIRIDTAKFYDKIVSRKRGGFCYELNGLFNELLRHLGFTTRLVSARVYNGTGHGPEFDHAAIIVTIGDEEYLADVGFGDFITEPLRFVLDEEQTDAAGTFIITRFDAEYLEVAKRDGDAWKSQYIFKDTARDLSEFADRCDFQQYSPESHFTKGKVCSLMTETGRKTLTDKKLIVTAGNRKDERVLESENEFYNLLESEFDIVGPIFRRK